MSAPVTTLYWESRYSRGGNSGDGSRGDEAAAKIELVNEVVRANRVETLLDLGCGDGYVAAGLGVSRYTGYDPSPAALALAKERRPDGDFSVKLPQEGMRFDLVLSMDVLFHLVDESSYQAYLTAIFAFGDLVLVYGTDKELRGRSHVRHRVWTPDVPEGWEVDEVPADFKRAWLCRRFA